MTHSLRSTPLGQSILHGDPLFLTAPATKLERHFAEFHVAHPEFYAEVSRRVFALVDAGAERIGMAMVFEAIRYDETLARARGVAFKANNSYRAYYARLLIHDHPQLARCFETRKQKAA